MLIANSDNETTLTIFTNPRITKIGKILRLTKIDELPNRCHVLKRVF